MFASFGGLYTKSVRVCTLRRDDRYADVDCSLERHLNVLLYAPFRFFIRNNRLQYKRDDRNRLKPIRKQTDTFVTTEHILRDAQRRSVMGRPLGSAKTSKPSIDVRSRLIAVAGQSDRCVAL